MAGMNNGVSSSRSLSDHDRKWIEAIIQRRLNGIRISDEEKTQLSKRNDLFEEWSKRFDEIIDKLPAPPPLTPEELAEIARMSAASKAKMRERFPELRQWDEEKRLREQSASA